MKGILFTLSFSLILSVAYSSVPSSPLWPDGHPALQGIDPDNVPTLAIYEPDRNVGSVPVIAIICPGGGYARQTMVDEGYSVAA